jgi:hypothetical protein
MEINKKELRKLSRAFRTISNRIINAHYEEADSILKMFLNYINNNHLIFQYINSINVDEYDASTEIKSVISSHGREILNTGSCVEEEIVYTYRILKYMVENNTPIISMSYRYGHSNNYQDMTKAFGQRVILPFVNHIESYLIEIAIDMGLDEETRYMITVHGGQVNIAKDQATINATQNNGINTKELDKLVNSIKALLTDEISQDEREIINDNVEVLQEELKKENPKKGFIRTAISGLQGIFPKIADATKLIAALTSIIQFAMTVL